MGQITINLLPNIIAEANKLNSKRSLAVKISAGIIMLMIVLTTGILIYRVVQISKIRAADLHVNETQTQVASLKEEEGLINILRTRITLINGIIQNDSEQTQAFNLITSLKPADIKIVNLSVNKINSVTLGAESPSPKALQDFFDNLTNPDKHQGKIAGVQIQNLGKGVSESYKFDLLINLKK